MAACLKANPAELTKDHVRARVLYHTEQLPPGSVLNRLCPLLLRDAECC